MLRAWLLAMVFIAQGASSTQTLSVLHIKVVLVDAEQKATPVARHALLISDNPASAPPRRIVTALDGTADVRLRPGNYTVESDQPIAFQGKTYQWVQTVDVAAGRDAALELTLDNAEVETMASRPAGGSGTAVETDPSFLLNQWQDSVLAIWTPTMHASGFVIDPRGFIATNQRAVGVATSVEVQLTPSVKVAARVLTADSDRDVAVLWIDPKIAASMRPLPLGCGQASKTPVAPLIEEQEIWTLGAPLREQKTLTSGKVTRLDQRYLVSDFILPIGSTGGPVFTASGAVVGLTRVVDDKDEGARWRPRATRIDDVCAVVASAEPKMKDGAPPSGAHLPVEPTRPYPKDGLRAAVQGRAGSLNPYQIASNDFDVAFITPVLLFGADYQKEQVTKRGRGRSGAAMPDPTFVRPLMDFGSWSEYMSDLPPVLLVRMTPRLVEGFWTTVARGAARTQGVSLPPIKRYKSGFSRMRAYCGDTEVTPIHPFKVEQRIGDDEAMFEGLYVFDPGALNPDCGTVKLVLYSEKEPDKADPRVVDPKIIQQIWQDFAPYRTQAK